jgi:mannose-6-phosphate isomerase-like protein (cupin superfamily)
MKLIATALLLAGLASPAGDPPGFQMWKAADLKALAKTLTPKINEYHVGLEQLSGFGNYSFLAVLRNGPGQSEYHATQADIFVVQSGEGTLVIGGQVVEGKTTAPNEIRGSGISGGIEKKIAAGDVVTIPAKTPHQVKVDAGKEILYMTVKITQ